MAWEAWLALVLGLAISAIMHAREPRECAHHYDHEGEVARAR
jgi:hypothetical protein